MLRRDFFSGRAHRPLEPKKQSPPHRVCPASGSECDPTYGAVAGCQACVCMCAETCISHQSRTLQAQLSHRRTVHTTGTLDTQAQSKPGPAGQASKPKTYGPEPRRRSASEQIVLRALFGPPPLHLSTMQTVLRSYVLASACRTAPWALSRQAFRRWETFFPTLRHCGSVSQQANDRPNP